MKILDININQLNRKLEKRNIKCLSPKYLGSDKKHEWLCLKCDHKWFTTYDHIINRKTGCPPCGRERIYDSIRLKITIEEINKKLKDRNIECLSNIYTKAIDKYNWRCLICDCAWEASYDNVVNGGRKCLRCHYKKMSEKLRLKITIEEINEKLRERNMICLSDKYTKELDHYTWKCLICEHVWDANYNNIKNHNKGCPKCAIQKNSGENHPRWTGGSRGDYPKEWNESKREFIRNRDNRKCQYPDCQYDDSKEKIKLHVHHINGNKKNCENWNLISLCHKHHMKIQWKYEEWQDYFYAITDSFEMV